MTGPAGRPSDLRVQGTNDSSTISKLSAALAGYFHDPFLSHFVSRPRKRAALIHRGYHLRAIIMDWAVRCFLMQHQDQDCQIVSSGAGFDTTYFRLRSEGHLRDCKYVELDFETVIKRKQELIVRSDTLSKLVNTKYQLVAADLRDLATLDKLMLDTSIPTLFLCECVLSYLDVAPHQQFLKWTAIFVQRELISYEPINTQDAFGKVMIAHYNTIGSALKSVVDRAEAREDEVRQCGWQHCTVIPANVVFNHIVTNSELRRLAQLEPFDEFEEFALVSSHYVITIASSFDSVDILPKRPGPSRQNFGCWRQVGKLPEQCHRFGHSIATNGSQVAIFGGFGPMVRSGHARRPEVVLLDLANLSSRDVLSTKARMYSTTSQLQDGRTVLIGGRTSPNFPLLNPLMFHNNELSCLNAEQEPPSRWRHSSATIWTNEGERIATFGGLPDMDPCLWLLDPSTSRWTCLTVSGPSGRHSHAACSDRNCMVVCGGIDASGHILGDVWFLDTKEMKWQRLMDVQPCFGHSCHLMDGHLIIVGGVTDDGKSIGVSKIDLGGISGACNCPPPTFDSPFIPHGLASAFLAPNKLLLVGGGGNCFSFGTHLNSHLVEFCIDS